MLKRKFKLVQKVPKTPKSAYNHGRFISSLLEHQIKHFNEVEKKLVGPGRPVTDISEVKNWTELQASKYLQKMTARLHPQGADKPKKAARRKRARPTAKHKPSAKKKQSRKRK